MGRGYSCGDFEQIVEVSRNWYPDISIAPNMIAGFPDEREKDHFRSLDLIALIK